MDNSEALWDKTKPASRRATGLAPNPAYTPPRLDALVACTWQGKEIPERQWFVPDWIPRGTVALFGGAGGGGKSLMMQMLLSSAAAGLPWLGLDVTPSKVLGIFCEDDIGELQRRQSDINRLMNIDFADLDNMHLLSAVGEDNALVNYAETQTGGRGLLEPTEFFRSIRKYVTDNGIQLVVLDSLHDLFPGNENSRPEVRRFVQFLVAMALDINGAVILTAHPSLSGLTSGSGLSGSTAWNNAVRSRLYLSRPEPEDGVEVDDDARVLSRLKANYARANDQMKLRWQDGAFVRTDISNEGFVGALDRAAQQRQCQDTFLDLLAKRNAEDRAVSHTFRSGNYAPAEFAKHPQRQGFTRRDFQTAMEALFASGGIRIDTYGDRPSRQFKRIVINEK